MGNNICNCGDRTCDNTAIAKNELEVNQKVENKLTCEQEKNLYLGFTIGLSSLLGVLLIVFLLYKYVLPRVKKCWKRGPSKKKNEDSLSMPERLPSYV